MQNIAVTTLVITLVITALLLSGCSSSSDDSPPSSGGDLPDNGSPDASDLAQDVTPIAGSGIDPSNASNLATAGQRRVATLAEPLAVIVEVAENHSEDTGVDCRQLGAQFGSCSTTLLHVKDTDGALREPGARLYFHSIRRILAADSDWFTAGAVNGDLYYIEARPDTGSPPEGVASIRFVVEFSQLAESDFMPRYWLATADGATRLLPNTDDPDDAQRYAMPITGDNRQAYNGEPNVIASAASRFASNREPQAAIAAITSDQSQSRIVPRPAIVEPGTGTLDISGGFSFAGSVLPTASIEALTARQATFMSTAAGVPLDTSIDPALAPDRYVLNINGDGIELRGADEEAVFHAAQSLLALVQPGLGRVPQLRIEDAPRYGYRGLHIDVARNFHDVDSITRVLDQMAAYKLDTLQLHLADDEGWRLEIPELSELSDVGGQRAFQSNAAGQIIESSALMPQLGSGPDSNNTGSGFFSREDFIALLRYADARFIRIIPAFDMPGHARAAVVAMRVRAARQSQADDVSIRLDDPEDASRYQSVQHYDDGILNPCVPGTYTFIETLVSSVNAMYADAGVTLERWHMGGDEATNIFKGAGFTGNFAGSVNPAEYDFPWQRSPACERFIEETPELSSRDDLTPYFVQRVASIVANAGIDSLYAYQDIYTDLSAADLATPSATAGFWRVLHTGGVTAAPELAARGFQTIIAPPDYLYFDFPQEIDPQERGYYWAARVTDLPKVFRFSPANLAQNAETSLTLDGSGWQATSAPAPVAYTGIQGHLWSESVRGGQQLDYMVFPRLLALAERAWHQASWELPAAGQSFSNTSTLVDRAAQEADLASFLAAVTRKELPKLDAAGVQYRIPVPGGSVVDGSLQMNSSLPGLPLQYSDDNSEWRVYDPATPPATANRLRALSADGQRIGRETELP